MQNLRVLRDWDATMLTGIDHIVIVVNDLGLASAAFDAAGFTVTPGGSHPTGTHNALIPFADGSYLELIAIEEPKLAKGHPWFERMDGKEGFVTFAVGADPLDYELERLAAQGIEAVDRKDGARTRPDGQELRWQSAALQSDPPVFLPFLIQDVTDRTLRVPNGAETQHRRGILGTVGLTVVTSDVQQAMAPYGTVLSAPVAALDHGFEGTQSGWRFFVEKQWVDLIQPQDDTSPAAGYRRTFGDGIYQIFLGVGTGPEFPPSRIDIPGLPDLHILTTN
ncbi:MAG: VOC family protein [Thermomicrobiales bacterium]|nr:VOC family protein [Thermomicrobiales bacterium]